MRETSVREPVTQTNGAEIPSGLDGPAQFCRMGTTVLVAFLTARPYDIAGNLPVDALLMKGLERFLDDAVFTGMERQDAARPPGANASGSFSMNS